MCEQHASFRDKKGNPYLEAHHVEWLSEGGFALWNNAIQKQDVIVHSCNEDNGLFKNAYDYLHNPALHLDCVLRTHTATKYYCFVNSLLNGDIKKAAHEVPIILKERYELSVTRDLEKAKKHVKGLYIDDVKTYGVMFCSGSEQTKQVPSLPFKDNNQLIKPGVGYFNYPDSQYYCKNLTYAATEFNVQGLELDMTLVHWDYDLAWNGERWKFSALKKDVKDPKQLKLNAYRVLLTRGRDGTIIYIPESKMLDKTWDLLVNKLGIPVLQ